MNFTCPHCGMAQIVTDRAAGNFSATTEIGEFAEMVDATQADRLRVSGLAITCANGDCRRVSVSVQLSSTLRHPNGTFSNPPNSQFLSTRLYPGAVGKPFPEHIPDAMLEDYHEAWSIIDLSAKSSATLARRCLQSMIRDFCKIKKNTLYAEIDALRELATQDKLPRGVDPDTIDAMLALKDIGNIGAHMSELDGVILDVEPGEAEKLLRLIEMLFSDWYVARGKRAERIAAVLSVGSAKKPTP